MDQLDAQINELAEPPNASVSIAACVAVAAQLALGHAVELLSVLHGQDLEAEAGNALIRWCRGRRQAGRNAPRTSAWESVRAEAGRIN
ncbi:hypothetical protein AB0K12_47015 [Nonomuraea sp. NPDC049419]|uniref:hypothetical protein n=1 Tax=Nonomuraea sp. NPDC049419 TaxID=3155772 RepID=UPI003446D75F